MVSQTMAMPRKHSKFVDFLIRLVREKPLGTVGGVIVVLFLFTAIFCEFLAPYGMNKIDRTAFLAAPSAQHLLGTDNVGRDILSRVIYGARISVIVGLAATSVSVAVSFLIGATCGFFGFPNFDTQVAIHRKLQFLILLRQSRHAGPLDDRIGILHPVTQAADGRVDQDIVVGHAQVAQQNVQLLGQVHVNGRGRDDRVVVRQRARAKLNWLRIQLGAVRSNSVNFQTEEQYYQKLLERLE